MTKIEATVLFWVSHDYESTATIAKNVREDLGGGVTQAKIEAVLRMLSQKGLVDSYRYCQSKGAWELEPMSDAAAEDVYWWYANENGRAALQGGRA